MRLFIVFCLAITLNAPAHGGILKNIKARREARQSQSQPVQQVVSQPVSNTQVAQSQCTNGQCPIRR